MRYVPSQGFPVKVLDTDETVRVVSKTTADATRPTNTEVLVADDGQEYVKVGPGLVRPFDGKTAQDEADEAQAAAEDARPADDEDAAEEAEEDSDDEDEA